MRHLTLDNGLRVVLDARGTAPAVGVAVHYGTGFRSDPPGRSGFAHLFEHLMFQGSARVAPGQHFAVVQGSGGTAGGSTHQDHTDFYQVAPTAALERLLFLEADRMAGLRLTEEGLRVQLRVIREEIRTQVEGRPYGGFPWTVLPGVLYTSFANAHNGYGDVRDLEQVTTAECAAFHEASYAPSQAVLTVCGGFDEAEAARLVRRHFGPLSPRPAPPPVRADEPPGAGREADCHDELAPLPALALGHRMPDPALELPAYLDHMVLSALLTGTERAELTHHLVGVTGLAAAVRSGCGFFGPLQARDPDTFHVVITAHPDASVNELLAETDAVLARLSSHGPDPARLARTQAQLRASLARGYDSLLQRTRHTGAFALLHDRPELVDELPRLASRVEPLGVAAAAERLLRTPRATLRLRTREAALV
ncbi:M16 family metallopeptidase [Streptomyces sp. NPDC048241]|uniref:M16 family metallopeptidase n=1 Tax=Streptomyces sp. NPDC048241 TaxID=3365521 RepID=UPI00371B4280